MESKTSNTSIREPEEAEFNERVQANQLRLGAELQSSYDFIVCGSGSSGSVVARRLAETGDVSVLLLEAGETDDLPNVKETKQWLANVGTERDWGFQAAPNPLLNGRRLWLAAGKVLGGGSSINAMIWSRGMTGGTLQKRQVIPGWSYESVLSPKRAIAV